MRYVVEKLAAGRWQVMRFEPGRMIGTKIGTLGSRKEALQCARLLAGWRGTVELFKRVA